MKTFFSKAINLLTGGFGETLVSGIQKYFPPSMSDQEKATLQLAIQKQADAMTLELAALAVKENQQFNERVAQLEGTASDLEQFGILGKLVVFARGCQRPVWGFTTLYMDFMWFSGKWNELTQQQESAFWVINLLVLGFLFGERAIKNLMPLITTALKAKDLKG